MAKRKKRQARLVDRALRGFGKWALPDYRRCVIRPREKCTFLLPSLVLLAESKQVLEFVRELLRLADETKDLYDQALVVYEWGTHPSHSVKRELEKLRGKASDLAKKTRKGKGKKSGVAKRLRMLDYTLDKREWACFQDFFAAVDRLIEFEDWEDTAWVTTGAFQRNQRDTELRRCVSNVATDSLTCIRLLLQYARDLCLLSQDCFEKGMPRRVTCDGDASRSPHIVPALEDTWDRFEADKRHLAKW